MTALAHPSGPFAMLCTLVLGAALGVVYLIGNRSLTPGDPVDMLVNLVIEPGLYLGVAAGFGG